MYCCTSFNNVITFFSLYVWFDFRTNYYTIVAWSIWCFSSNKKDGIDRIFDSKNNLSASLQHEGTTFLAHFETFVCERNLEIFSFSSTAFGANDSLNWLNFSACHSFTCCTYSRAYGKIVQNFLPDSSIGIGSARYVFVCVNR